MSAYLSRPYMGPVAEPTVTRDADGYATLHWPASDPPVALISRELMEEIVNQVNELVTLRRMAKP